MWKRSEPEFEDAEVNRKLHQRPHEVLAAEVIVVVFSSSLPADLATIRPDTQQLNDSNDTFNQPTGRVHHRVS